MGFSLLEQSAPIQNPAIQIDWEETPCLLCGRDNASPLVEAADQTKGGTGLWFAVVQCQDCGLCYTNPRPSVQSIGQFYPSVYRPHRTPSARRRGATLKRWLRGWRKPRKERQHLPKHGKCRLLDFGCGGGSFLERMSQQGWQTMGVDVSEQAVQRIREELGLEAVVGTLPHPDLEPCSFDVITMWHSLEHVHQPLQVLREARRLLAPGGKLIVAVPNIDSVPFRWFGSAWFALDLPRHLTHFAPWTLHLMLEQAGFRVQQPRMIRHSDWLRSSAKRACATGRASSWHHLLTFKPAARLATWYSYWTDQTDCILVSAER